MRCPVCDKPELGDGTEDADWDPCRCEYEDEETPSEPAANAYDNDGNPIALSVTNGEQASADEARDHFAAHYVIKRGDGNMHYADAVKSGWNAAIEFVKGGNKNGK